MALYHAVIDRPGETRFCGLYLSLALTIHKFCVWGANRLEGLVEPCEQTIVNEAGFVVSLVRNAVKPPLMLADADSSDGAKLTYRIRKTYVQSSAFTASLSFSTPTAKDCSSGRPLSVT